MYELMCTFFFICHIHTLASDARLGQPNWRKNRGQFSQKKVWLVAGFNGEFVGISLNKNLHPFQAIIMDVAINA